MRKPAHDLVEWEMAPRACWCTTTRQFSWSAPRRESRSLILTGMIVIMRPAA